MNRSQNISQIKAQFVFCFFIIVLASSLFGAPSLSKSIIEAEDVFSKEKEFTLYDDIYSSNGRYIALKEGVAVIPGEVLVAEVPFPQNGTFSIWIRLRDLTLSLRGSNGISEPIKAGSAGQWGWVSAGRYTSKQIGALFDLYAVQCKTGSSGLDAILLCEDPNFRPEGVYNEYARDDVGSGSQKTTDIEDQGKIETVEVTVSPQNTLGKVSPYLATACVDFPKLHLMDDNPRWDATMNTFFQGNMLILLCRSLKEADRDGNFWDFETLDKYVEKAINVWGCKDLLFLPQWWLEKPRRHDQAPTQAEMDAGEEIFMQLVRRYGQKGKFNVKYWAVCDEWTLSSYWKNHTDEFVKYYARLVRVAKKFNPELKCGGPVNAWPSSLIIAKLLEECPQIDFIAWNMYISGNAATPIEMLYKRTSDYLGSCVVASREIAKKIRNENLPVIITAYGPNYRAWNPPDFKLAGPPNGVWQALAMSKLVESGCFAAGSYNVQTRDCGLFGPLDRYGIKGGYIPNDIDEKTIYIRPSARVMRFFQKYITSQNICSITSKNAENVNCLAVNNSGKGIAIVLVNFSSRAKNVEINIQNYKLTTYKEFDLPTEYLYCDQDKVLAGRGFIFNGQGNAKIHFAPFSSWLVYVEL